MPPVTFVQRLRIFVLGLIPCVLGFGMTSALMGSSTGYAQDPRATANPCKTHIDDPRNRRSLQNYVYNGVDKLAAPMDRLIKLPREFIGDWKASCVFVEIVVRQQGDQLLIERATPRSATPQNRSDMLAPIGQAAVEVLRQVPLAKVLPRKPVPGVPQLIMVPLWPGHPFYRSDAEQVIGQDLREIGYADAFKVGEKGGVSVYKVWEHNKHLIFVALRDLRENDTLAEFEEITPPPGSFERHRYRGAVSEVFRQFIEPTLRSRKDFAIQVEVRHYARGLRFKNDYKNTAVGLQLAVDPVTRQVVDHPLLVAFHVGYFDRAANAYQWKDDRVAIPPYKTIGQLNALLAELNLPQEEKTRRAQIERDKVEQANAAKTAQIDKQQREVRERSDPANALASLGYPNATSLLKARTATYFLSEVAPDRRVVVALHDIGDKDPIFEMEPGPQGGYRYTPSHIAWVRQQLLPPALAQWPELTRLVVHHHVRGQNLEDTAEFRRWIRSRGLTYEQPLFAEEYGLDEAGKIWRPFYELGTWSPERALHPHRHEYDFTIAQARVMRARKSEESRLAKATPEQRRAELRERRAKEQAARSPHHVYKSDYYWASRPRFYIPQKVFEGDFNAFQINTQFPKHFRWFLEAYSSKCRQDIEKRDHKYYRITTTPVRVDQWGNVRSNGEPTVTEIFVDLRFVTKYEAYGQVVDLSMMQEFLDILFGGDGQNQALRSWDLVKKTVGDTLALAVSWKMFFREVQCDSGTLLQMRENMYRAANGMPSLQAAGIRVANAAAESEPLVTDPKNRTIFDACYEDNEFKAQEFCRCMDEKALRVMSVTERRRYSEDFSLYYKENVFPDKSGPSDPRWRLHQLVGDCKP